MKIPTCGCLQCGFLQTWPRPTPAAVSEFYREKYRYYYQGATKPNASYAARFHKGERLEYTAELIAAQALSPHASRVLDIGCAEGTLFSKLSGICTGLQFVGIEPSTSFAAYAHETTGCATYRDIDTLTTSGEGKFDLIVVNHVLEHVEDPVAFLNRLIEFLAPLGALFVDVPNADSYAGPEMLHIAHLFHFTPRTLKTTLARAGWQVVSTECHVPPNHPASVWCVGTLACSPVKLGDTTVESERSAWDRMRSVGKMVPPYLLRQRLGSNRALGYITRVVRRVWAKQE